MRFVCSWSIALGLALLAGGAAAEPFDASLYDRLLLSHTRDAPGAHGVRVDYVGLSRSEDWRRLVDQLARSDPDSLRGTDERLAFWINAYNILAIDLVLTHRPASSIRDIGSFFRPVWKIDAGSVGGRPVSLGWIEHEVLRPMGEPRIHGAIVCASISCPPLARAAWRAASLPAQFAAAFSRWLADPATGLRVDAGGDTLFLSRVFDWFAGDFAAEGGVLAVIEPYLGAETRAWLAQHPAPRIRYLDYDWRLNAAAGPAARD